MGDTCVSSRRNFEKTVVSRDEKHEQKTVNTEAVILWYILFSFRFRFSNCLFTIHNFKQYSRKQVFFSVKAGCVIQVSLLHGVFKESLYISYVGTTVQQAEIGNMVIFCPGW